MSSDCKPSNLEVKQSIGKLEICLQIPSPLWEFICLAFQESILITFPKLKLWLKEPPVQPLKVTYFDHIHWSSFLWGMLGNLHILLGSWYEVSSKYWTDLGGWKHSLEWDCCSSEMLLILGISHLSKLVLMMQIST